MKLGRTVRWGDTGPFLFTRVIEELGYGHRALANGMCYPVHHSEAADLYDEETLEHALLMQTELRTRAEENRRLTAELGTSVAERERWITNLATGTEEMGRLNAKLHAELGELVRKNELLERKLDVSAAENERRRAETETILNSTSWRLRTRHEFLGAPPRSVQWRRMTTRYPDTSTSRFLRITRDSTDSIANP